MNVYKNSSGYLQKGLSYDIKHVKNSHFSHNFGTTVIFRILFLTDFDASKSVLESFFAVFAKIWPKNMHRSSNSLFFSLTLLPGYLRWPLDLYYGHKTQEVILKNVSDTIHADSLALFAINIEILLADVTKPEISNISILARPLTTSVTSRSNLTTFLESSRTGISNGVCIFSVQ